MFSSIIQAQSIGINLTEMKTLIEKGVILVLERRKKTEHQETEAKVKLEIVATD